MKYSCIIDNILPCNGYETHISATCSRLVLHPCRDHGDYLCIKPREEIQKESAAKRKRNLF